MMNRRDILKLSAGALTFSQRQLVAQEKVAKAVRGLPSPKIKDVSVIATAPSYVSSLGTMSTGFYCIGI